MTATTERRLAERRQAADEWRAARQARPTAPQETPKRRRRRTRPIEPRPFVLEPLERLVAREAPPGRPAQPTADIAERLGITRRQVARLRHLGLTVRQADELAVALGRHPSEIWADWFG